MRCRSPHPGGGKPEGICAHATGTTRALHRLMREILLSSALTVGLLSGCDSKDRQAPASHRPRPEAGIVEGPAGKIRVDDGGAGGVPVVFLHSFGGDAANWRAQLGHLRAERRAIAVDLRGHGGSDRPRDGDYTVPAMAADVAAVADALGLQYFVLVGHSMGGSVAVAYAGRFPERVAGLVAVGTPGRTPPEQASAVMERLEARYDETMAQYWQKLLTNARPEVRAQVSAGIGRVPREDAMRIIQALFAFDPTVSLRRYPGPKLSVTPPGPDQPGDLHVLDPSVGHLTIAGTSHWIPLDAPEEFDRILDRFLGSIGAATASL